MKVVSTWLCSVLVLCVGCGDFGSFTITEESGEVVIESQNSGLLDVLPTDNLLPPLVFDIDLQQRLEEQNATGAKGVYLEGLELEITPSQEPDGDSDDFDFIQKVDVYVESSKEGSSLARVKIAWLEDVPADQKEVAFTVDEAVDLKPYVEEGVTLTTEGSGSFPEDDTSFIAVTTLRIDVL